MGQQLGMHAHAMLCGEPTRLLPAGGFRGLLLRRRLVAAEEGLRVLDQAGRHEKLLGLIDCAAVFTDVELCSLNRSTHLYKSLDHLATVLGLVTLVTVLASPSIH
jgi:hypothetical protein